MAYTTIWDNTAPLDSSAASLIGQDIRTDKIAVMERMNDVLGITDWATQVQPMLGKTINLAHDTTSYIIPGTVSLSLMNNANLFANIAILDNGSITLRNTLTISGGGQFITGGLTINTGGLLISAGGMGITSGGLTISAGGFTLNGGGVTVSATGSTSTFNKNVDVTTAQARVIEYANGNSGAAMTVNWNNSNNQSLTLTANCTLTFSNPQSSGFYFLRIVQDGTGTRTITWPTIKWAGAAAPVLTVTAAKQDFISFYYDGTSYNGFPAGFNY